MLCLSVFNFGGFELYILFKYVCSISLKEHPFLGVALGVPNHLGYFFGVSVSLT